MITLAQSLGFERATDANGNTLLTRRGVTFTLKTSALADAFLQGYQAGLRQPIKQTIVTGVTPSPLVAPLTATIALPSATPAPLPDAPARMSGKLADIVQAARMRFHNG